MDRSISISALLVAFLGFLLTPVNAQVNNLKAPGRRSGQEEMDPVGIVRVIL